MILDSNILLGVLAVAILALTVDIFLLRHKVKRMLGNKKHGDLGEAVLALHKGVKDIEKFRDDMQDYLNAVEKRLRRSVQASETVRFNAFRDQGVGGNQSFATAFLSEDGDGAVISSLYSRDRVSVFSKPLAKFDSEFELSEEERRAVSSARTKLSASKLASRS